MAKKDIEAGEARWLKAFNGGDASGVAQVYASDGRLLAPNAEILEGRMEIEAFGKEMIAAGAQVTFELLTVHETPDLDVAVGRYVLDFPADSGVPQDRGKYIEVWKRQADGSFLIQEDIFNSSLPLPAP